ncbi:MAG: glycosyltransferase family 39 protein [Candidatus Microsaccharimonas sp.]
MATRDFSKYFLYRWRYVIGYSLVGLLLAGMLLFAGLYLPGGLSEAEMTSVVRSAQIAFSDPSSLVLPNLPYYLFQAGVFSQFGVSVFTIKLPSLILALVSAVGVILLLRRWFRPNIAVLASLIAITTGQFIYLAQSGTPSILYIFWPVLLLLLGTQITRGKKFRYLWKILFAIAVGLSLYTPLSIYPLIAIALAVVLHPHLRNVVRRLSKPRLAIVTLIFAAVIAPLVWLIITKPQLGITLLVGVLPSWPPDIAANSLSLLKQYFLYWEPSTTEVMAPVFGLGSSLLILLGFYRLFRTRDTTRSYLIIFWIICLLPVLLLNPNFTSVTFIPSLLMLAAGLTSLISYWYRLFPFNPYARIVGLIPIVTLVGALIITGVTRYTYGYHYSPVVAPLFSNDLRLLPASAGEIIVGDDEKKFYEAVAKYRPGLMVVTSPSENSFIVTREARQEQDFSSYTITDVITNPKAHESDRYYVMTRGE